MAVTQQTPLNSYTANGSTTVFAYNFLALQAADLKVLVAGVLKTLGADYSVSGAGNSGGGAVTFIVAPTAGQLVTVYRDTVIARTSDYQNNGDFLSPVVNADFDRPLLLLQEIVAGSKGNARAVRAVAGETLSELPAASVRANRILSFDSNGDVLPIVGVDSGSAAALQVDLASSAVGKGSKLVAWILRATGAVARWVEDKLSESVSVADFGAVGNGVADDSAAINAALTSIGTRGGCVVIPNGFRCRASSTIVVPINCLLTTTKAPIGIIDPPAFDSMGGAILLDAGAQIQLTNASQLRGILIQRYGMLWGRSSAQVTAEFINTAVVINDLSSDAVIEDCTILGFATAIRSAPSVTNVSRVRIRRCNIDCLNGVLIENSYDVCYLQEIHCWPFCSVNAPAEVNGAQLKRSGTGIQLLGVNDWTKVTDCFTYGYATGMRANNADSVTFLSCGNDHPTGAADSSIGFLVDGDSFEVRIELAQCAAKTNGIYINTTATDGKVTVSNPNVWESKTNAIVCERGMVLITNPVLRNTGGVGVGIATLSTVTEVRVAGSGSVKGFLYGLSNASSTTRLFHTGLDFTGTTTLVLNPFKAVLASADPLPLDGESQFFEVTGTTSFGTVNNAEAYAGKAVVLKFTGALTVNDGGASLKLNGSYTTTADDTLTLVSDGTAWYETARSVN
jgi:Pectate lyase superfamily protein